ncbi:MAG: response regulator transcription factor [Caldilineaceae bacterium]|nr:response regulator transcription factor [Caldilineaceae bacterium]
MEKITILIADDSTPFREGMRAMLRRENELTLTGEAISGVEAIRMAIHLQPDVVLMDLHMPDGNGIDATRAIVAQSPHIRVLVLTMFEDDDSVFAALQAGARGYLLKGADKAEILRAIRAVHSGEAIFGPAIAQRLMGYFATLRRPAMVQPPFPELTGREREILSMIAQGRTNQEIAADLVVSLKTVRNHVSNIFSKLHVADRAQAMSAARKAGLGAD